MSLRARILLLIGACMLGMLAIVIISLYAQRSTMLNLHESANEKVVSLSIKVLEHFHEQEARGDLSREQAQKLATEVLSSMHEGRNYVSARTYDGIQNISPNPAVLGKPDTGKQADGRSTSDAYNTYLGGSELYGHMTVNATRPGDSASAPKYPKRNTFRRFEPWGWIVISGSFIDDVDTVFWQSALRFLGIGTLLLAILATVGLGISRRILQQLGGEPLYASKIATQISSGDLSGTINFNGHQDSLLGTMKTMQDGLRQMVERFRAASAKLSVSAGTLSHQMSQVSQSARATAESTSSTAAAVEEMTVSVAHISENARDTMLNATSAAELAADGENCAKEAADEIRHIADHVREATEIVRGLVDRTREIDRMSTAIKEIADQTNLLALNAAIEAARAGEMGSGFAVVADEVRKLAERTARATEDIMQTIRAVKNDTDLASARMDTVRNQVTHGVELAEKAASSLQEIHAGAKRSVDQSREVANASQEQSQAANAIATNIEAIAQMTEESDAAVQEVNSQVLALENLATELDDAATKFRL
jgi:methyl-accepting chemotaxis protein